MNRIKDIICRPITSSNNLKLYTIEYIQDGRKKSWELSTVTINIEILIYHPKRDSFVFLKQFRPAAYFTLLPPAERHGVIDTTKHPTDLGITIELCAGPVDHNKSIVQNAKEIILEICGYDVPIEKFENIYAFCGDFPITNSIQIGFYCEISDDMKVNDGRCCNEDIEIVEMTVAEVKDYIKQELVRSPTSLLSAVYWFFYTKNR